MIKGIITCSCGQLFGFETEQEKIHCPMCGKEFVAKDYEVIEPIVEDKQETSIEG